MIGTGLSAAILSLRPSAKFVLRNEEIEWRDPDQTQPTDDELQAEMARLDSLWLSKQYQRDRQPEYPSLAEFADAYYWSQKGDDTKMTAYVAACDAVKTKYPKPEAE